MNALEDDDLAPEAELYELFRPHRPDAAAFRDGVARRIAEKERERAEQDARVKSSAWRTAFARRAAAVLPPEVATALLGGKLLSTTLALPALVLGSTIGAFVASARSLERSAREAAPVMRAPSRSRHGLEPLNPEMSIGRGLLLLIQGGAILVMLAPFLLGARHAIDAIVALLVISMAALAITVRGFARAGLLSRREVAQLCAGLLLAVYMGCFLWANVNLLASDAAIGLGWSAGVVLAGFIVCAWIASGSWKPTQRLPLGFVVVMFALLAFLYPFGWTRATSTDLRGYLASFEAHTDELRGWSEAEVTYVALRSTRAELPDLAHVRAAVELAIDHHDDSHPTVWTAAATMHLIDIEHWRTLAARPLEQHKLDQWLASSGRLHLIEYDAYQLDMLLATRELTGEQCERVAARIEASWPAPGDDRALDRAALCVRLFDTLGRQDAIERHRADVHELLRRHWISGRGTGPFAKIGGFSSYPAKLRTSFDEATWRAVDLIARCGAPPEIDMRLLHGYLRTESAAHGLIGETYAELKATERAALLRLEREIGLPSRHWLATLLGERVLIGSTLIVALCFLAIRFAAPTGDDALAHARSRTEP